METLGPINSGGNKEVASCYGDLGPINSGGNKEVASCYGDFRPH